MTSIKCVPFIWSLIGLTGLVFGACVNGQGDNPPGNRQDPTIPAGLLNPPTQEQVQTGISRRVEALSQSGPDSNKLSQPLLGLQQSWEEVANQFKEKVYLERGECFADGCFMVSRHRPSKSLSFMLAEFTRVPAFQSWNAAKFQGAPFENAQGEVEITWIFFAPMVESPLQKREKSLEEFGRNTPDSQTESGMPTTTHPGQEEVK